LKTIIHSNPCSGATHLRFKINDQGLTITDLYQVSGIRIKRLKDEVMIPGTYEIKVDLSGLPAGVYFIRLMAGDQIEMKKLIKL